MSWDKVDRRLTWFAVGRALDGRVLEVYRHLLNYAWRGERREVGAEHTDGALISLGPHVSKAEMLVALGTGKHQLNAALQRLVELKWIVKLTEDRAQEAAYKLGRRVLKPTGKGRDDELLSSKTLDAIEEALAPKVKAQKLRSAVELPIRVRLAAARGVVGRGAAEPPVESRPVSANHPTGAASPAPPLLDGAAGPPAPLAQKPESPFATPPCDGDVERKRQASLREKRSDNLSQERSEREGGIQGSEAAGTTTRPTTAPTTPTTTRVPPDPARSTTRH